MEYVIGLLVAAIGAVFYFKRKADDAKVDAILGRTRGQDDELREQQEDVEKALEDLDKGIEKIEQDKDKDRGSKEDRAKEWD